MTRNQQNPQISAPGPGNTANSMNQLLTAVKGIQQAIQGLEPGSPLHRDALQAVTRLSRHLPQGAPTAGVQMTGMRDLMQQIMRSPFMAQIMQQLSGSGGGGRGRSSQQQGGPPGPAGAQPNMAPMPSMPLPGA
jgi:hypothetical protein